LLARFVCNKVAAYTLMPILNYNIEQV
jgi:hypothetical protein